MRAARTRACCCAPRRKRAASGISGAHGMVVAAQHGGDFPALRGAAALRCRGVHGPGRLFQQMSGLVQVVGDTGRVCGERGEQRDDRVRARLPYLDEVPSGPVTSRVAVLQMPFGGQRVRRLQHFRCPRGNIAGYRRCLGEFLFQPCGGLGETGQGAAGGAFFPRRERGSDPLGDGTGIVPAAR